MFKAILIAVVALTVLSLAVCTYLVVWGPGGALSTSLFKTCETTWKMGFGAILGLISGHLARQESQAAHRRE